MIDVVYIGNDIIITLKAKSAPGDGEWVKLGGKVYVVAKVMHEYSPATDSFTAHVLIASVPANWFTEE